MVYTREQEDPRTDLRDAIDADDYSKVEVLITAGGSPSFKNFATAIKMDSWRSLQGALCLFDLSCYFESGSFPRIVLLDMPPTQLPASGWFCFCWHHDGVCELVHGYQFRDGVIEGFLVLSLQ